MNQIFAGNDENVENGAVASARAKFTVSDPDLTLAQVSFFIKCLDFKSVLVKFAEISVLRN